MLKILVAAVLFLTTIGITFAAEDELKPRVILIPCGQKVVNAGFALDNAVYLLEPAGQNYTPNDKALWLNNTRGVGGPLMRTIPIYILRESKCQK